MAYQVGGHGRQDMVYDRCTGFQGDRRPVVRVGFYGAVVVPWKHPAYWDEQGRELPDL